MTQNRPLFGSKVQRVCQFGHPGLQHILTDGAWWLVSLKQVAHRITDMANRNPTIVAGLLLAVMFTVTPAGQDTSAMVTPVAPSAACHQHHGKAPVPRPASYRCCQVGHDAALLQSSPSAQPHSLDFLAVDAQRHDWVPAFA